MKARTRLKSWLESPPLERLSAALAVPEWLHVPLLIGVAWLEQGDVV